MSKTIALVMGDPAGVGPELMARLLDLPETRDRGNIIIVGDRRVLANGERIAGVNVDVEGVGLNLLPPPRASRIVIYDTGNLDPATISIGVASAAGGRSTLENFSIALDLARGGHVAAICYGPFNKEALRLGGNRYEDELSYAVGYLSHRGPVAEYNVIDQLWNARVTSHVPLQQVASLITEERILERLGIAVRALKQAGIRTPRIAVAALNPHAGDGGLFGREEIDIISPAIKKARRAAQREGFLVEGPFPSDTVFLRALRGEYDAVLTMFHDQGQIAIKLLGFDRGVTVLFGLPVPISTPAHGTAYDRSGKNTANLEPTRRAFEMVDLMTRNRSA